MGSGWLLDLAKVFHGCHDENQNQKGKVFIKKIVTLSIYMYIQEFQKGALLCEPLCQTVLMASS